MARRKDAILPVGVCVNKKTNKYVSQYWDTTTKHNKVIGQFDTIEQAFNAREDFIKNLKYFNGHVKPIDRGLPKGVLKYKRKKGDVFTAQLCFVHGKNNNKVVTAYLGTFKTPNEAHEARKSFISKLL